jgi:type IV pilus assembly protein PilB
MSYSRKKLGEILVGHGVISEEQLTRALEHQKEKDCRLGDSLIELGLCTELEVARAMAEQNDIAFVDFDETPPAPNALRLISKEVAQEYGIIPARIDGPRLVVAALNPYDYRIDEVVKKATDMEVLVAGGVDSQMRAMLQRYDDLKYGQTAKPGTPAPRRPGAASASRAPIASARAPIASARAPISSVRRSSVTTVAQLQQAQQVSGELLTAAGNHATVQKVNKLIAEAVRKGASDLYVEPEAEGLRVRCRIDGYMQPLLTVPKHQRDVVIARLKVVGGLQSSEDGVNGSGHVRIDGRSVELTAALLPAADGEILALRFINSDPTVRTLHELGLDPEMLRELKRVLMAKQGLVLVSAPVGHGRPTTLYALLHHLHTSAVQTFALESTFERKLSDLNQVVVQDRTVNSFANALELCLKQKPQAVMIGELPDRKSAEMAVRAASTGQMILAGSHAPDAFSAVTRILDMGVPAHDVAASLAAVLSQRLVRKVCDDCARDARVPFHLDRALRATFAWPESTHFRKGRGRTCKKCHGIGSRGLVGSFELLIVDDDLRYLLSERVAPSVIQEHVDARRSPVIEEDAFRKASRGLIEPEEVTRLGMKVAALVEEMAAAGEKDEEEAVAVPSLDEWTPTVEEEVPEPESWDEIANMANLLG